MDWNVKKAPEGVELTFIESGKEERICIGAEKDEWEMFDNSEEIIDYLEKEYLADRMPLKYTSDDLHIIAVTICNEIVSSWDAIS